MTLLRSRTNDFIALVAATSQHFGIPEQAFVEKDYWVVELLRSLAEPLTVTGHDFPAIVFKGGTSLSKGWGLVQRFSEDVDILAVPAAGMSKNAIDKHVFKPLIARAGRDLGLASDKVLGDPFRQSGKTHNATYLYQAHMPATLPLKDGVFLEMGVRGGTEPGNKTLHIRSYIAEYLEAVGEGGEFTEEAPVVVSVLAPVRTLFEKLSAVHTAATDPAEAGKLATIGRHYYDIHALLNHPETRLVLETCNRGAIVTDIGNVCGSNNFAYEAPPTTGYAASAAFDVATQQCAAASASYATASTLFYGTPPSFDQCLTSVAAARDLL
ncbi:MAG: nucleotidyl transferase AbiEii/AbiGii toxin family protein [Actinomycetia bacterium]|nr:nucleotidyl transferase AbiEii/AbiGii toxin family protein [Actinomycetes bacterium]